jgi:predicted MPP superfamily phosphohydrolase
VERSRAGFRAEEIVLTAASLQPGAPPLRFAHLTDLHLRSLRKRHERLVSTVNERRPDFVCLTGDIIGSHPETWELVVRLVSRFECRHGVFACPGNWEAKCSRRTAEMKRWMARCGVELLVNESRVVETPAGAVRVSGVDDLARGWPNFAEALSCDSGARYSILLSHAPLSARMIGQESGVDLVLSGHTHGGQVRVPLLWRMALPSCHGGFVAGLYRMPYGWLYVNRGFGGAAWMPFRFRSPAEVAFFEVRPA